MTRPTNHTDARTKESAFGALKLLVGQGGFALPRHPALLNQLAALEFETLDSGNVRIAVPERRGHDDLAMSLALAMTPMVEAARTWSGVPPVRKYRNLALRGRR